MSVTYAKNLLVLAALTLLVSAAEASETILPITSAEVARVAEGERLVSGEPGDVNRGVVIGLVNAPVAEVDAILQDVGNHDQWFPDTNNTVVISSEGASMRFSGETEVPVLRDRQWTNDGTRSTQTFNGVECVVFTYEMVPGTGNMDELFGYWLLCPHDASGGTIVKYVINADLGIPLPNALLNWAARRMLPGVIDGLQARYDATR